jgi:hypothetical protein
MLAEQLIKVGATIKQANTKWPLVF